MYCNYLHTRRTFCAKKLLASYLETFCVRIFQAKKWGASYVQVHLEAAVWHISFLMSHISKSRTLKLQCRDTNHSLCNVMHNNYMTMHAVHTSEVRFCQILFPRCLGASRIAAFHALVLSYIGRKINPQNVLCEKLGTYMKEEQFHDAGVIAHRRDHKRSESCTVLGIHNRHAAHTQDAPGVGEENHFIQNQLTAIFASLLKRNSTRYLM